MAIFMESVIVPFGKSVEEHGMRIDQHDVAAELMRLPLRQAREADLHPGASQLEVVMLPLAVQQLAFGRAP